MIQLSILKIMGYGPWTLTLGSDREHELQMLQASLYKEVQRLFSEKGCIAFLNRADEFFIVSNGLELDGHVKIQQSLRESFDVRLSMSIGCADSPFEANLKAHEASKSNILMDKEYDIFGVADGRQSREVSIMHLDVDDLTSKKDTSSPFEISLMMFDLYARMSRYFAARNSLAFFMGGDNFMVVASQDAKQSVKEFIHIVRDELGISLNCGIGNAPTAREATKLATKSLDTIRKIRDSGKERPYVYELSC